MISKAIVRLFDSERFYAEIILRMRRISNPNLSYIAGVCIKNQIELHINPTLFGKLTNDEQVAVLKHECEHILRDHIPRSKILAPEVYQKTDKMEDDIIHTLKHRTMNIAADCAINGSLRNLPEGCIKPELFDLSINQTMEWYLEKLKDNEKAKDYMEVDGHSLWAESEDQTEALREKIRQAINKAAKNTRAAGKMTSDDELLVSKLNANTVNWREQLKKFVARSIETSIESSKKKRNRRYGVMYPGSIKTEDLHIGVAIDTSGSISDKALTQFISEITNIAKFAKVTVVEVDTEIKDAYVFNPSKEYRVKGRGGTAYKPAFDYFNTEAIDAMIYFGDMDCYDTEVIEKPKYPVLWAIVGNQKPPVSFGARIKVTVNE